MPEPPLITMTLIARDEADNIDRCFSSWWDDVDEVVLVDTGSTDGTIERAKQFARKRKQARKLKTARFEWVDDFAAARQAADELATGEWLAWCDLDDEIRGMDQMRRMAAETGPEIKAFFIRYAYARDPDGHTISELWRERLVRNDGAQWQGRLHEHKMLAGAVVRVPAQIAEWIHHRDHEQRTGERNLRILEAWKTEEPGNARILHSLAMEYMGAERHQEAADTFGAFLEIPGEAPDRRAQASRHLGIMLMILGKPEEAKAAAYRSLAETPLWADTYLTLAEAAQTMGRPAEGLLHAQQAMQIGQPDTMLIVNPQQYTAHPRMLCSVCLAQLGRHEEAVQMLDDALAIAPSLQLANAQQGMIRGALKRQHAVGAVIALSDVLIEVGELEKARTLLDQAPFYISTVPELNRKRAEVTRQIADRLAFPDPIEADEQADEFVNRWSEAVAA